nr:immunoglobulin heavy chain junction region [Macaca mulatta]
CTRVHCAGIYCYEDNYFDYW